MRAKVATEEEDAAAPLMRRGLRRQLIARSPERQSQQARRYAMQRALVGPIPSLARGYEDRIAREVVDQAVFGAIAGTNLRADAARRKLRRERRRGR